MQSDPHFDPDGFRLRGLAFSRLDAFSDVVFGFALTILVVSLEVPHTFAELHTVLRGFLPFAICFALLTSIWHGHYKFFRRFGVHDFPTIVLNSLLLFVVLFYVYPLKFLFTFIVLGGDQVFANHRQLVELMVLYAIGFTSIYVLQAALYYNAYRQRDHLDLTPLERLLTRGYIVTYLGIAAIGLIAALIAVLNPYYAGYTGLLYLLVIPWRRIHGMSIRRRARRLGHTATAKPQSDK